jgi:uncharacterized protein YcbK (DUF882 family)
LGYLSITYERRRKNYPYQQEATEDISILPEQKISEEELSDIEQMLSDYYAKKTQRSIDDYVREQVWTQKDLERMSKAHIRTPYQK